MTHDTLHFSYNLWHMTHDNGPIILYIQHFTHDTVHMSPYTWHFSQNNRHMTIESRTTGTNIWMIKSVPMTLCLVSDDSQTFLHVLIASLGSRSLEQYTALIIKDCKIILITVKLTNRYKNVWHINFLINFGQSSKFFINLDFTKWYQSIPAEITVHITAMPIGRGRKSLV